MKKLISGKGSTLALIVSSIAIIALVACTGPAGTQGTSGQPGSQGTAGIEGSDGSTGSQGVQGKQGSRGASGPPGSPGSEGPIGPAGAAGEDGRDGKDAVNGVASVVATQSSGGTATIYGSGFKLGEAITLIADDIVLGSQFANVDGSFQADVDVSALEDGLYTLWANGSKKTTATAPLLVGSK
ncbi:MAG: Collagen triple helix repeat-containing protein [Chloroflexi bacterium]|nr:MAG: Collagen triple helix repeat-containing protein [Chloroflexota bacterium]